MEPEICAIFWVKMVAKNVVLGSSGTHWRLKESLLGGVKLFEKTYPDKYVHTGYGFGFDSRSLFSLPDGSNSVLFVNATKICQFKAKGSDIKKYLLSFRNISGHFSANNMTKQD